MIKEFKEFIMRGSVLDLAVGVVIGSAFTAIVTQVVEGLITPLISLIFVLTTGKKSADDALGALVYKVEGVEFNIGSVIKCTYYIFNYGLRPLLDCQSGQQNEKPWQKRRSGRRRSGTNERRLLKRNSRLISGANTAC